MTTFRLSTAARAALTAFIETHDGVHVPSASHVENAIVARLSALLETASVDDIAGARISYRSAGPATMSYGYAVRGLAASFIARRRVIDLVSVEIEKVYPKKKEKVQVVQRIDEPVRIRIGAPVGIPLSAMPLSAAVSTAV